MMRVKLPLSNDPPSWEPAGHGLTPPPQVCATKCYLDRKPPEQTAPVRSGGTVEGTWRDVGELDKDTRLDSWHTPVRIACLCLDSLRLLHFNLSSRTMPRIRHDSFVRPLLIPILDNAKSLRLAPCALRPCPVPSIPSVIQPSTSRPCSMPTQPESQKVDMPCWCACSAVRRASAGELERVPLVGCTRPRRPICLVSCSRALGLPWTDGGCS
ncbi:hypothetical protein EDB81DRAFT_57924 [Dactylonectria macrodidyma]|uniref:Uncharacterized protein n=1 Tax=Dactylonectria macrodidyma TaxID=307937 RepID=A0A9P9ENA0_9HYPO|nr:hypothetical protein EDB81DRAFT_57924 [Dactylonectria macrodidyma]